MVRIQALTNATFLLGSSCKSLTACTIFASPYTLSLLIRATMATNQAEARPRISMRRAILRLAAASLAISACTFLQYAWAPSSVPGSLRGRSLSVADLSSKGQEGSIHISQGEKRPRLGSCIWSPAKDSHYLYSNTECMKTLTERIMATHLEEINQKTTAPLRWLFLGDSTMGGLFTYSPVKERLLSFEDIQQACPSEVICHQQTHLRCELNKAFLFPPMTSWRAPNLTLGEGPSRFGLVNANCQDCSGCNSAYVICNRKQDALTRNCVLNSITQATRGSNHANKPKAYGGYFSVEFARDVEVQTSKYETTQENVASFIQEHYNSDPWLLEQFGGRPICVVSAGIHDMTIPDIGLAKFLVNVEWYLGLLMEPCGHIVWLQNTAPERLDSQESQDTKYPQTQESIKEWNDAVHQVLVNSQRLPQERITIVDVFEASRDFNHQDNVHLAGQWYRALGTFFTQVAQELMSGGSLRTLE